MTMSEKNKMKKRKKNIPRKRTKEDPPEPMVVQRDEERRGGMMMRKMLSSRGNVDFDDDDQQEEEMFVEDEEEEEEEEDEDKEAEEEDNKNNEYNNNVVASSSSCYFKAKNININRMLKACKPNNANAPEFLGNLSHLLRPTLRPYQKRAVGWMMGRERAPNAPVGWENGKTQHADVEKLVTFKREEQLSALREMFKTTTTTTAKMTLIEANVVKKKHEEINLWMENVSKSMAMEDDGVRGGVLAEEMGLGKTVELLMLCLAHKKPKDEKDEEKELAEARTHRLMDEEKEEEKEEGKEEEDKVITNRDGMGFTTKLEKEEKEEENEEMQQVRCVCGAMEDDPEYKGLWVSCEVCHKWSHAYCVGIKQNCTETPDFICPHCHAAKAGEKIPGISKTTLIVVPSTILQQWRDEVLKHVRRNDDDGKTDNKDNKFDILVYEGQPQTASLGSRAVHAKEVITSHKLAECDIVITTYDVLRAEINLDYATNADVNDGALRARRNATRRYPHIPPPLTKITWWRVIMDEAQMVGGGASAPSQMMERIPAVNRWCVTGTPLSSEKSHMDDAFGLFKFLRARPFGHEMNFTTSHNWWQKIISAAMKTGYAGYGEFVLTESLKPIMWRNAREDVIDELDLPPQNECVTELEFSPIEKHFYEKQHKNCAAEARNTYDRVKRSRNATNNNDDIELSRQDVTSIVLPLLRLRQACDHPQVGSYGISKWRRLKNIAAELVVGGDQSKKAEEKQKSKVLSMEEIHDRLVDKARLEAEEAQRLVAFSINAIAGLKWTQNDLASVIECYREVLRLDANANINGVRLDSFQRLHALHNLAEALQVVDKNKDIRIPRTLRDEKLLSDAETEKISYLAERVGGNISIAANDFEKSRKIIDKKMKSLGRNEFWWMEALSYTTDAFVGKLLEQFDNRWQSSKADWNTGAALKMVMQRDIDRLFECRNEAVADADRVTKIVEAADRQDVVEFASCSVCRKGMEFAVVGVKCAVCKCDANFNKLQSVLFGVGRDATRNGKAKVKSSTRNVKDEDRRIYYDVTAPSCAEKTLKALKSEVKGALEVQSYAKTHIEVIEEIRKEFTKIRALMHYQREKMYALDELSMSTTRIRLRTPNEMVRIDGQDQLPEYLRASIVYPVEVPTLLKQHGDEKVTHEFEMKQTFGQLRYLQTLKQKNKNERKKFDCPLCLETFDETKSKNAVIPKSALRKMKAGDDDDEDEDEEDEDINLHGAELAILPCGHELCVKCSFAYYGRPSNMVSKKKQFLHSLSPLPERHNNNNDNKRGKCPTCRQECATKEISYVTWKSQDKDVRDNVEEAQKKREERLRKKAEESLHLSRFGADVSKMLETLGAPETHARDESGIKIEGAWGTKIDAVVRRVKHLSKFDTNLKVLIFSEWEDVLMIVDHALKMNGVNSIVPTSAASSSLKTKRAGSRFAVCVKEFVDSDSHPVSCLLLPLKRAGAGLNLTCANHVILLEPSLDISAESQAIKRIDRIGQTKSTIIHRFVLKDSIEKNVMKVIENRRSEGTVLPVDSKEASKLTARDIEELLKQQQ